MERIRELRQIGVMLAGIVSLVGVGILDVGVIRGYWKPCEVIVIHAGKEWLKAEVARTEEQREKGLMDRGKLGENEGMLFVLPKAGRATFWMKDTRIPLSIAYMDGEGRIMEMYDMKAEDETIIGSKSSGIRYALEVREHWFMEKGIEVGDKIECSPESLAELTPQ